MTIKLKIETNRRPLLTSIEPPTEITDRQRGPFHTPIHIAHMAARSGLISSGRRHGYGFSFSNISTHIYYIL